MSSNSTIRKLLKDRQPLLIVVAVFAIIGSVFVWSSFANPNLPGDINNDNVVNITDLSILLSNYGKRYSGTPGPTPTPTPIPPTPNPTPNPTPGGQPPITRDGTKLMRAGKQWKFAGINADKWFGCWGGAEVPNDAQLEKYFKELNPGSLTRIWPYDAEGDFPMMDKVVSYAEKHNQYLMVTLFDGNDNQCGSPVINKGNPSGDVARAKKFAARYAKGTGTKATNSIAFWESSNEESGDNAINWFMAMADGLKEVDPRTLVSTGSMPRYNYSGQDAYERAHGGKVDIISIHEYDAGYSHWSGPAIEAAKKLNKPWFSGESGLCCGGGGTGNASSDAGKLKTEWDDYLKQTESAGMLYWALRNNNGGGDIILAGGPMWDMAKNYRHQWQGN